MAARRNALMQAMAFELAVQRAAADAKETCGNGLVPLHHFERSNDMITGHVDERRRLRGSREPLFHGVDRRLEILVASHQDGFASRPQVSESAKHVETGHRRPDQ